MKERKMKRGKTIFFLNIFCIVIIVIAGSILGAHFAKTSNYYKTSATITKIVRDNSGKPNSNENAQFVTYEFEFDNINYQVTKKYLTEFERSVGDVLDIRFNPENPNEIETMSLIYNCYFIIGFVCLLVLILNIPIRRKKIKRELYEPLKELRDNAKGEVFNERRK